MKYKYYFLLIVAFFMNLNLVFGQKQIWEIYTVEDQPYSSVILDKLDNDTLYVKATGNIYKISVKSIKILKRERKSKGGIGILTGMAVGGIVMNLLSKQSSENTSKFPISNNSSTFLIYFSCRANLIILG